MIALVIAAFGLSAAVVVLLVHHYVDRQALSEARQKARLLLDRNLATHAYFTEVLRPRVFSIVEPYVPDSYFDPVWMSSTYAVRAIEQRFRRLSPREYSGRRPRGGADPGAVRPRVGIPGRRLQRDVPKPRGIARRPGERVEERTRELSEALAEVRTLSGIVPICAECKNVRDDAGYWQQVEAHVSRHTDARFSHGLCPTCEQRYHDELDALEAAEGGAETAD